MAKEITCYKSRSQARLHQAASLQDACQLEDATRVAMSVKTAVLPECAATSLYSGVLILALKVELKIGSGSQ